MMANQVNHEESKVHEQLRQMATAVGDTCYSAAVTAYENARMDGLCHEGAWECALEAMRSARLNQLRSE